MNKEDLYNETQRLLDAGEDVMMMRKDGEYCLFSPKKDTDGNYKVSGWENKKEEAQNHLYDGYPKKDFIQNAEDENWSIISSTPPTPPIIPKGTKVKVIEDGYAKEVIDYVDGSYKLGNENVAGYYARNEFTLYLGEQDKQELPEIETIKQAFDVFSGEMNKLFNK